jgi:hypothetical protein
MAPVVPLVSRTVIQNAFVVNDIHEAMDRWTRIYGVGPWFFNPDVKVTAPLYRGQPTTAGYAMALAQAGSVQIELIQPLDDQPSCYRDLYPKGTEGPHHIAIFAADYDAEYARYVGLGYEVAFSGSNRDMRFAYIDTSKDLGVMVEILEDVASVREAFARVKEAGDHWDGTDPIRGSASKPPTA